ncbi:MAG: divalent-cation tolerance protein CutA [Planctomycetales bacterium]|nr:divalent-cation tolerance protein CutA [Planctomycetales bacterium]
MNRETDVTLVLTTAPDRETAEGLARAAVEERLAACGTVLPGAVSIYRWEGKIASENEVVLLLKTTRQRAGDLIRALKARHPYKVPEFLAVPVSDGWPPYLEWVAGECSGATTP